MANGKRGRGRAQTRGALPQPKRPRADPNPQTCVMSFVTQRFAGAAQLAAANLLESIQLRPGEGAMSHHMCCLHAR
jgi:hypothetical protein